jgi:hypothetical protein
MKPEATSALYTEASESPVNQSMPHLKVFMHTSPVYSLIFLSTYLASLFTDILTVIAYASEKCLGWLKFTITFQLVALRRKP